MRKISIVIFVMLLAISCRTTDGSLVKDSAVQNANQQQSLVQLALADLLVRYPSLTAGIGMTQQNAEAIMVFFEDQRSQDAFVRYIASQPGLFQRDSLGWNYVHWQSGFPGPIGLPTPMRFTITGQVVAQATGAINDQRIVLEAKANFEKKFPNLTVGLGGQTGEPAITIFLESSSSQDAFERFMLRDPGLFFQEGNEWRYIFWQSGFPGPIGLPIRLVFTVTGTVTAQSNGFISDQQSVLSAKADFEKRFPGFTVGLGGTVNAAAIQIFMETATSKKAFELYMAAESSLFFKNGSEWGYVFWQDGFPGPIGMPVRLLITVTGPITPQGAGVLSDQQTVVGAKADIEKRFPNLTTALSGTSSTDAYISVMFQDLASQGAFETFMKNQAGLFELKNGEWIYYYWQYGFPGPIGLPVRLKLEFIGQVAPQKNVQDF
jgi:hypothetical protein